jgi:hypothetical protein
MKSGKIGELWKFATKHIFYCIVLLLFVNFLDYSIIFLYTEINIVV